MNSIYLDETKLKAINSEVGGYTLTGWERIFSLVDSVCYVLANRIEGSIVECGVWRGGSMMAVAKALLALGVQDRKLILYDTFSGMSIPTAEDISWDGVPGEKQLQENKTEETNWLEVGLETVRANLLSTGYPAERLELIEGKVEDTLQRYVPDRIAILRLDTDWYESTRAELQILYPHLSDGGVLIVDDYGHWKGAKKALDEFISTLEFKPLLHRIDYSGRLLIKRVRKTPWWEFSRWRKR